jgi:hypothetical protein
MSLEIEIVSFIIQTKGVVDSLGAIVEGQKVSDMQKMGNLGRGKTRHGHVVEAVCLFGSAFINRNKQD